ncbi:MAG: ABC transporter ATP-binding protein [Deltaproteobacteria bacterium]|nr:MAG: ABC transporter ATP-binding protein [Deltaproteobacteria bacterium]
MIELQGVSVSMHSHEILHHVTFSVGAEEVLAIVGPSGSGKSTLLRVVLGFIAPSHGSVDIGGVRVSNEGRVVVHPEERHLAMVFQDLALWPHMTVREHLQFAHAAGPRTEMLLQRVGLAGKGDRRPSQLSGGERQRVALARALAADPRALLLDEPLSNVDVLLRRELIALLREVLAERQLPVLLVTHDLREAGALADRVAVMDAGRLVQIGTIAELQARPATRFVEALLADRG